MALEYNHQHPELTDRTQFLAQNQYRAVRALCQRLGTGAKRRRRGEAIKRPLPPDVTDYTGRWLGDLYWISQIKPADK